jgi:hypothetical protein
MEKVYKGYVMNREIWDDMLTGNNGNMLAVHTDHLFIFL